LERSRADVHQYGTPYEIAMHCHLYAFSRPDPEESRALYEQALATYRAIGATWEVAFVIDGMGHFALALGQTLEAKRHHEEALALYRASGELQGTSDQLENLSRVAYTLGDYDEGRRLLEESLTIQQAFGLKNTILDCDCQEVLGEIASAQGQFAEAEARFRQELALVRDLGYRERLSWSLSRLGAAVLAQNRLGEAAGLLAEALAIAEECGDRLGISRAHNQLGYLALRQGALDTARRHWRTAVDLAWRVQDRSHLLVTLDALMGLATILANENDVERAVEVLALVRAAARIDKRTETQAEQVLAELEVRLSPARFAAAQARGHKLELGATVAAMLAEGAA
jgi:tetratricopeptide (TPR) repeat protein